MAGNYLINIPPLPPLANPYFNNVIPQAAGITAGSLIHLNQFTEALIEYKARKLFLVAGAPITAQEVHLARMRCQIIQFEQTSSQYGMTPAWLQPVVVLLNQMNNTLTDHTNLLTNHTNLLNKVSYQVENGRRRIQNLNNGPKNLQFVALRKEQSGEYPHLANITPFPLPLIPPIQFVPPVGAIPPLTPAGVFPDNLATLMTLTDLQILQLVQWYNDDMGILPGDAVGVRRTKLQNWIMF
eukprot:TRINITY_DN5014_c0_g1_i1.p1 TRINITY_DN5014_c0_g1~~TRINITY_DN5014_c0_g1_i1.p1  ORF type:complete len:240 (+),score=30.83 TRINITY_DN5014_c0_g1_i1:18-737(+)